jgi:hypothetical protein
VPSAMRAAPDRSKVASCGRLQHVSLTRGGRHRPLSEIRNASRSSGSARIVVSVTFADRLATMYLQMLALILNAATVAPDVLSMEVDISSTLQQVCRTV